MENPNAKNNVLQLDKIIIDIGFLLLFFVVFFVWDVSNMLTANFSNNVEHFENKKY